MKNDYKVWVTEGSTPIPSHLQHSPADAAITSAVEIRPDVKTNCFICGTGIMPKPTHVRFMGYGWIRIATATFTLS